MSKSRSTHPLLHGIRVTGLGTLASRILGMIRDMATAALLGLSGGGAMDAFVIALRIPNLFRRLFAEGALAASYLPVLTRLLEEDRRHAWQLASVLLTCLAVVLMGLLLLGELACWGIWAAWGTEIEGLSLVLGLTATMLPYAVLICLAAQVAATLHALSHFTAPALAPTLLNVCWLAGVWFIAPTFGPDREAQVFVLAGCVLAAGVFQLALQAVVLFQLGFRFDFDWTAGRGALGEVVRAMAPMVAGLAITQVNTLMDNLIAWGLSSVPGGPDRIAWLGNAVAYPMRQGASAAIYYGERLYQFPLGILGLAVATAIFPLLSRHAIRKQFDQLGADLTLGLRMVLMLSLPAGIGLMLLAEPITRLLFEHGQFDATDVARTARMITCYSMGVWAYCALPVLVRGYYALGDRITPVRVGAAVVGVNLVLNFTLIWPLAEAGLAVATSISAAVQVLVLTALFSRRKCKLNWPELAATLLRAGVATGLMVVAAWIALSYLSAGPSIAERLVRVLLPVAVSVVVYGVTYHLVGGRELNMLLGRGKGAGGDEEG